MATRISTVEELLASAPAPDIPVREREPEPPAERPRPTLFGEPIKPPIRARPRVRMYRRQDGKRH